MPGPTVAASVALSVAAYDSGSGTAQEQRADADEHDGRDQLPRRVHTDERDDPTDDPDHAEQQQERGIGRSSTDGRYAARPGAVAATGSTRAARFRCDSSSVVRSASHRSQP